jgi:hypothetical protein
MGTKPLFEAHLCRESDNAVGVFAAQPPQLDDLLQQRARSNSDTGVSCVCRSSDRYAVVPDWITSKSIRNPQIFD